MRRECAGELEAAAEQMVREWAAWWDYCARIGVDIRPGSAVPSAAVSRLKRALSAAQCPVPTELEREVARLRSAIWAYFTLGPERRSQAESILRSALPDDYKPVGG